MKKLLLMLTIFVSAATISQAKSLHELQQEFVNLKFGLFIHFGMGTYLNEDWADPEQRSTVLIPHKVNFDQ